jgi:LysR family glycine cleavage system transcriptional activator
MPDLPPLQAIRVFAEVARTGNFTRAAEVLNMTQSAVSYQVKQLERHVGSALFIRQARGVVLSAMGRRVAPIIQNSLDDLRRGFHALQSERNNIITISTMQTIAGIWLAPRIGRFQRLHPHLTLRIEISNRNVDLENDNVDVVIRSGNGQWPGLTSHFLLGQEFTPVCSPHYIEQHGRPETPADLSRHHLIALTDPWWQIWFAAAGLPPQIPVQQSGIDVETQQLAATLAMAGSGIALVTPAFVADDVRAGRLLPLFSITAKSGSDYYFAYPRAGAGLPKIAALRQWILAEAGHAAGENPTAPHGQAPRSRPT